jgi:hypothetical protein
VFPMLRAILPLSCFSPFINMEPLALPGSGMGRRAPARRNSKRRPRPRAAYRRARPQPIRTGRFNGGAADAVPPGRASARPRATAPQGGHDGQAGAGHPGQRRKGARLPGGRLYDLRPGCHAARCSGRGQARADPTRGPRRASAAGILLVILGSSW